MKTYNIYKLLLVIINVKMVLIILKFHCHLIVNLQKSQVFKGPKLEAL